MRFSRWLLILLGIVVVLVMLAAGPGSIWVNSIVHSDAFRSEVETRAGQTLGGTVKIQRIDFGFWSGVQLSGLATKFDSPQGTVVAQMEDVNCSISWLGLLSRKLQLDGLTLVKPQIVLTQEPPATVPLPTPPTVPASASSAPTGGGSGSPLAFVLEAARVSNGRLSIRDATGATKADLQGVEISANTGGFYTGQDVTGTIRIATVALPQNLGLTDFSTPFT